MAYNDVTTVEGLQAVRKRPSMYIGSTVSGEAGKNPRGLLQIAQEILSNATDEALVGYGSTITLTLHDDGSLSVQDEGRGHPMGEDYDAIIRSATVLHTSGKFDSQTYLKSGGQNGIGMKATNALSVWFKVSAVTSVGDDYSITFHQNTVAESSHQKADPEAQTGTCVRFLPDPAIFDEVVWDRKALERMVDNAAYLTPGVTYVLEDHRGEEPYSVSFRHDGGMTDLLRHYVGDQVALSDPIVLSGQVAFDSKTGKKDPQGDVSIDVDVSLVYTDAIRKQIISFANGIPTKEGGPHVEGAERGVLSVLSDYGRQALDKRGKIELNDIREGLVMTLSLGIPESLLQFESQTKEKLGTTQARVAVKDVVTEELSKWLYDHPDWAKGIFEKIEETKQIRQATKEARAVSRSSRKGKASLEDRLKLSSKLTPARGKDPKRRELFIVEGDSAGGSAKQARDPETQAVLPLKGKPLNVSGMKLSKILKNEEMRTIISVLGAGVGSDADLDHLQYDKVIIMADADVDGEHIVSLLINNFWWILPELIEGGHLYVANAPLFKFSRYVKGEEEAVFALDNEEYDQMKDQYPNVDGWQVHRMKGLGEMDYPDLQATTMDPEHRRLTRVMVSDPTQMSQMLELLLGNNRKNGQSAAARRRDWLQANASFVVHD